MLYVIFSDLWPKGIARKPTNYIHIAQILIYTQEKKWLIKYYNIEPELSVEYTVVLVSQNNLGDEPFELPHSRGIWSIKIN